MAWISLRFSASLLFCAAVPAFSVEHSLFYTYTALSKNIDLPGIYEFIALGMLDDRELDYYNSKTQVKVPRQKWMEEKMEKEYWDKGTKSRKSKEQWFKVNVAILMDRMRHNDSDLHVLQWRHGCVIESESGAFIQGIDEYSYDGVEFLSFDVKNSRWIAPVSAAEQTKKKWDEVDILNQYTKSYLQKECVDWLTKFMNYGQDEINRHAPPDVQLFAKKSLKDSAKLTLTCLATGFYPKDVQVSLRKGKTSIPEHLLTSSGVRPNGDGTYQLRKSIEILEDEKAIYDCQVSHSTLQETITVSPGKDIRCLDCTVPLLGSMILGLGVGILLTLAGIAGVMFLLVKTRRIAWRPNGRSPTNSINSMPFAAPLPTSALLSAPAPAPHSSSAININMISDVKEQNQADRDSGKGTESSASSCENMNEANNGRCDSAAGDGSYNSSQEKVSERTPMLEKSAEADNARNCEKAIR